MMRQAAWLTVLMVMVWSLPVAATEAVMKRPTLGLASAAAPIQRFIQVPATGWDPGANARKRYAGGIFDWVRRVDVDRSALASNRIQIELFDEVLIVERTEPAGREPEIEAIYVASADGTGIHRETTTLQTLWVGQVVGRAGHPPARMGKVRINALNDGRLATNVTVGMINYELIGNLLIRIDLSRLPGEAPTVRDPHAASGLAPIEVPQSDEVSTVRVLFSYGRNVLAEGTEVVFMLINDALELANEGFAASGILVNLQKAGHTLPDYPEESVPKTLDDLVLGTNGPFWLMHRARPQAKADIMLVIVNTSETPSLCGQAQQILATKETAFAVIERHCLKDTLNSLAHEVGHLFGADHDPENATIEPPKFAYGHGYQAPENAPERWRTVMAQECGALACARINRWSSPHVSHNGLPTGSEEVHDNVRVLNETRAVIAAFYPDPGS